MIRMKMNRLASALVLAFLVASLYSGVLVVVKEEYHGVYEALKSAFTHHWIGHGITTLIVFGVFVLIFNSMGVELTEDKAIQLIWTGVILNFLIIAGYFIAELL